MMYFFILQNYWLLYLWTRGGWPMEYNAIIINLVSGNYLQFDENGSSVVREGFPSYDSNTEKTLEYFLSINKPSYNHQ